MSRPAYRLALVLLVASGLLSCGGGGGGSSGPSRTLAKATPSGDTKSGTVGHKLADSLRVLVTQDGTPMAGVAVAWNIFTGAGSVALASSQTGVDGVASTSWTLGTVSGAQKVRATLSGAAGSPQTFTATALPDAPDTVTRSSGNNQSAMINTALASPLGAKVADQYGNGVPGVKVGWEVTSGSATLAADTTVTDAAGVARVGVMVGGTAGTIQITAGVVGLTATAVFAATATAVPTTASVSVGNTFFRSARNATQNPAVDTIAVGGTVTWTWVTGASNHNIISTGTLTFLNEGSSGTTFSAPHSASRILNVAGTYEYHCSIHGTVSAGMRGRIIVVSP